MSSRKERVRVSPPLGNGSRTKQAFAGETDINAIMRKYRATGQLPVINGRPEPRFGDFTNGADFMAAQLSVARARTLFEELPAKVRDHCDNDPAELLDLVFDPERREECVSLGLVSEAPQPEVPAEGEATPAATSGGTTAPPPPGNPPA